MGCGFFNRFVFGWGNISRMFNELKFNKHKALNGASSTTNSMYIKTYVFFDSETTGLPFEENNKTRMTEICLTAVQSDHISMGVFPRIQSKITLCFNPRKLINPGATKVSGLSNDLLEYQPEFNSDVFGILQNFLNLHQKPVCLVAHNGDRFDYPILRAEIHKSGNMLSEDILCIDSLRAFRELHYKALENEENVCVVENEQKIPIEFQDGFDELLCTVVDDLEKPGPSTTPIKLSIQEVQARNEITPPKQFINTNGHCAIVKNNDGNINATSSKRKLFEKNPGFKLGQVYKRLTAKEPTNAHRAECDVSMLLECAATFGQKFVDWSNLNAKRFCDIPMMTPGKKFGT